MSTQYIELNIAYLLSDINSTKFTFFFFKFNKSIFHVVQRCTSKFSWIKKKYVACNWGKKNKNFIYTSQWRRCLMMLIVCVCLCLCFMHNIWNGVSVGKSKIIFLELLFFFSTLQRKKKVFAFVHNWILLFSDFSKSCTRKVVSRVVRAYLNFFTVYFLIKTKSLKSEIKY